MFLSSHSVMPAPSGKREVISGFTATVLVTEYA